MVEKRKKQFKIDAFNKAKIEHLQALDNLNKCYEDLI